MYGRNFVGKLDASLKPLADVFIYLVPLAGGIVLLGMAARNWHAVAVEETPNERTATA
jgi:MFS transporter, PAT family, beta-lactamase induction signal transducer AmpG